MRSAPVLWRPESRGGERNSNILTSRRRAVRIRIWVHFGCFQAQVMLRLATAPARFVLSELA